MFIAKAIDDSTITNAINYSKRISPESLGFLRSFLLCIYLCFFTTLARTGVHLFLSVMKNYVSLEICG